MKKQGNIVGKDIIYLVRYELIRELSAFTKVAYLTQSFAERKNIVYLYLMIALAKFDIFNLKLQKLIFY